MSDGQTKQDGSGAGLRPVPSEPLLGCRCGAKSSQVIRAIGVNYWTCYCNSCGRNDAEGYGKTRDEAIADYNRKQAND